MLNSWLKLYFISGMVLGILIAISSNSWFMAWFGLEMNLICFIPFLMKDHKIHSEAGMIYFLIQTMGSLVMLMFGVTFWFYDNWKFWINIALLLKVGAAPFHFWYIKVAKKMKWGFFLVLSTIQKVAPLTLLSISSMELFNMEMYVSVIMSGLVSGMGGLYTLSMRELLIYSSINHLGWMLISLLSMDLFWMTYLVIYCFLLSMVVMMILKSSIYYLNQLSSMKISLMSKMALAMSMMSFGGLPPFVGFIPKWGVIMWSSVEVNFLCLSVLIVSSVISLYYYIRAMFSILLINSMNKILPYNLGKTYFSGVVIFVNTMGFWFYPLIMFKV